MQGSHESLLLAFLLVQREQCIEWLLNYRMYAVVVALLVLSLLIPAYRATSRATASLAFDYIYGIFNIVVTLPLAAVIVLLVKAGIDQWLPWLNLHLYAYLPETVQVLVAILIADLIRFVAHVLHHKIRPFWHFHTIHHSQQALNPFTTKRTHICEKLISVLLVGWMPLVIMGSPPTVWIAYFLLDAAWAYFIHSNLRISLGPLKYVIVSPLYHRLHHSAELRHFDKNFADRFVIWDVLFGTADFDFSRDHATGTPAAVIAHESSLDPRSLLTVFVQQFVYPFRMIAQDLRDARIARSAKAGR